MYFLSAADLLGSRISGSGSGDVLGKVVEQMTPHPFLKTPNIPMCKSIDCSSSDFENTSLALPTVDDFMRPSAEQRTHTKERCSFVSAPTQRSFSGKEFGRSIYHRNGAIQRVDNVSISIGQGSTPWLAGEFGFGKTIPLAGPRLTWLKENQRNSFSGQTNGPYDKKK